MVAEIARVAELEKTVEELVAYLRRLPANPETYRVANAAEAVLQQPSSASSLTGSRYLPHGLEIISAELKGMTVSFTTADVSHLPAPLQARHQKLFFEAVVRGISVPLAVKDSLF